MSTTALSQRWVFVVSGNDELQTRSLESSNPCHRKFLFVVRNPASNPAYSDVPFQDTGILVEDFAAMPLRYRWI